MADRVELTIERLGHLGEGIASGPIFVPMSLPGEVVSGVIEGKSLTDVKIVTPSSARVSPKCRHFKACGGCSLQHAADDFVAEWKVEVVKNALSAKGLSAEFLPIQTSAPHSRRRASFSARRTKKGVLVGFHARASHNIIELSECMVLAPELLNARQTVEKLALIGSSRKGELSVLVTTSLSGLDFAVTNGKPLDTDMRISLAQIAEASQAARISWEGEVIVSRHQPEQLMGNAKVVPPPGSFLQATQEGQTALVHAVMKIVEGSERVVDLFSGCGTFSLPAAVNSLVHAVEGDRAMTEAMDKAWRRSIGLKGMSFEARDLFRRPLQPDELNAFSAAIIDPPRAGAEAQIATLAKSSIRRIAMVSCNPVTFARDAKTLSDNGFNIDWVQVVDQFRWSPHIELAASLTRH